MAIRNIRTGDDTALYKVAKPVEKFDERLHRLIDDMAETMYAAEGCGLAANQVGVLRRVVVIDVGEGLIELINPKVISATGVQGAIEGCLSFPGQNGYVERPMEVVVCGFDRYGELHEYKATGLFARAVMHETDHLDGKVYLRLVTEPPEDFEE